MSYLETQNATALLVKEPSFSNIAISTATYLTCNSSSEARLKRIEGITTPKEFRAIVDAISFAKSLEYPMTTELIQSLSGIKRQANNSRVVNLITSIIELNQIHDDIYTENCRKVYRDDDGEYIVNPDGLVDREASHTEIEHIKKIETFKKENSVSENKSVHFVEPIAYRDHETYTFIPILLSLSFLLQVNNGKKYHRGVSLEEQPVMFYGIEPYKIKLNSFGIDAKHEKHVNRLVRHLLDLGLDKNMIFDLRTFSDAIGLLFGYAALKHLPQYKKNLKSSRSIARHGKYLLDMYIATSSKGGYVNHRVASVRFFTEKTVVNWHTDLFEKKKVPMGNHHYIVYKPMEMLDAVAQEVFDFIKQLKFHEPENREIRETNDIFSFDFEQLMDINIRDRMTIVSHSIGVKDGRVWVHTKRNDNNFNRVYSLITTIKSESRLGLNEYDMGTAQQTIMMNVVDDWNSYPLHDRLINNKKEFRGEVMKKLGCDYDKAKEHITAISNGRGLDYYKVSERIALKPLYEEAQKLSKAFMAKIEQDHPFVYTQALALAKEAGDDDFSIGGKRFYGTMFHAWTHFERQVRNTMKSCFIQPVYDVHDAVYSREQIDPRVLEQTVQEQTRFRVKIEG